MSEPLRDGGDELPQPGYSPINLVVAPDGSVEAPVQPHAQVSRSTSYGAVNNNPIVMTTVDFDDGAAAAQGDLAGFGGGALLCRRDGLYHLAFYVQGLVTYTITSGADVEFIAELLDPPEALSRPFKTRWGLGVVGGGGGSLPFEAGASGPVVLRNFDTAAPGQFRTARIRLLWTGPITVRIDVARLTFCRLTPLEQ